MNFPVIRCAYGFLFTAVLTSALAAEEKPSPLKLAWEKNMLTISGTPLPGGPIKIHYIEAYCRPGSTDRDWGETTIKHRTKLLESAADGSRLKLQCTLADGVVVTHDIRTLADNVDFRITATNPTDKVSQADWARPCLSVDQFTGGKQGRKRPRTILDGPPAPTQRRPCPPAARDRAQQRAHRLLLGRRIDDSGDCL